MTVAELCRQHRRIGLDTNLIIYVLENAPVFADVSRAVLNAVESGQVRATLAAIGLAELATGPAAAGDLALIELYADELRSIRGLTIAPLTADVALDAAVIRSGRHMGLADAIHLASTRAHGASAFVTNDRTIRGSAKLEVIYLSDLTEE